MDAERTAADKTHGLYSQKEIIKMTGLGFRPQHFSNLKLNPPAISWLEIIAENYIDIVGPRIQKLRDLSEIFGIAIHGVSLNLASSDAINQPYLLGLKKLIEDYNPLRISDHLCWSGSQGYNFHDLLPFPYTEKMLQHIQERVDYVQNFLGRPLLLENLSSYVQFSESEMSEYEFLNELCKITGAKVLLDINNIYVNSINHGFSAKEELLKIDPLYVEQLHIAGHTVTENFLIDTHSKPVCDSVWDLFQQFYSGNSKKIPFCIEWDDEIPSFEVILSQLSTGQRFLGEMRC